MYFPSAIKLFWLNLFFAHELCSSYRLKCNVPMKIGRLCMHFILIKYEGSHFSTVTKFLFFPDISRVFLQISRYNCF